MKIKLALKYVKTGAANRYENRICFKIYYGTGSKKQKKQKMLLKVLRARSKGEKKSIMLPTASLDRNKRGK